MERIQICGGSGSGKTTLGQLLAQRLGLPFTDLDDLYWEPGWQEAPRLEFVSRVQSVIEAPRWVMAGNYHDVTSSIAWPRLTTLIVLDLPLPLMLWRSFRRTVLRGITRSTCCNGNTESLLRLFHRDGVVRYLVRTWRARRERYRQFATLPALRHVRIVHLTSADGVAAFIGNLPGVAAPTGTARSLAQ
jgi:adenylate kinase family enzyme